jgi:hypothetical protein
VIDDDMKDQTAMTSPLDNNTIQVEMIFGSTLYSAATASRYA